MLGDSVERGELLDAQVIQRGRDIERQGEELRSLATERDDAKRRLDEREAAFQAARGRAGRARAAAIRKTA